MNSIKDFKSIADNIMSDINVSDELKQKTLAGCMKKHNVPISKFLVPAACFILIFSIVKTSGILPLKTQIGDEGNPEINIMAGTGEGIGVLPGQTDNNKIPDSEVADSWVFKTFDEVKESFGSSFLIPSYIPDSFKLDKIYSSGSDDHKSTKVILSYSAEEQSFLVIEDKTTMQNGLVDYKTIDLNGIVGYLKNSGSYNIGESNDESKSGNLDTELHWFKDQVHYSVTGQITENEAIKVAASMK